ncbi:PQQ-dependent sugar dehydrogenase, partial [Bacteriovoracaceae bacterium]|nr:PQQ-dependent sugar dehydrogenase [Bacteriovoracaceae bacterium]
NNKIYLTYSKDIDGNGATTLATVEFDQKNKKIKNFNQVKIFQAQTSTSRHFGSRMAFNAKEKALYLSIGDRGDRKNGQNTLSHAGTILKLDYTGKPHSSNPYLKNKKYLPEIYSYGHRNPQGIFFLKEKNELWSTEHGPRGGDELNKIEAGKNYGWPIVTYGKEYWGPLQVGETTHGRKGMQDPKYQYTPSIAPSSLMIYQGSKFPKWKNLFFISALKHKHINVLTFDPKSPKGVEFKLFLKLGQRIRHLAESPLGDIWFSTDSGRLYQITK